MEIHWPSVLFGFIVCAVTPLIDFVAVYILTKIRRSGIVRCPKCYRKMALRPAWHHCFACDTYVITDFEAFMNYWHQKEITW